MHSGLDFFIYAIDLQHAIVTSSNMASSSPQQTTTTLTALALGLLALLCSAGPCSGTGGGASVPSVVTEVFFNRIKSQAGDGCEGKNFYTRGAFLSAAGSFPGFARGGSDADGKREVAAFFAHATYETGRKLTDQTAATYISCFIFRI